MKNLAKDKKRCDFNYYDGRCRSYKTKPCYTNSIGIVWNLCRTHAINCGFPKSDWPKRGNK